MIITMLTYEIKKLYSTNIQMCSKKERDVLKRIFLLLTLFFCALLLLGCQSQDKEMTLLDNISSVSIAESDGYGGVNDNYFATIDKDAQTLKFQKVLKNAEGTKQKVDVAKEKPDYDIVINYENDGTHLLHLVLGGKGEKAESCMSVTKTMVSILHLKTQRF